MNRRNKFRTFLKERFFLRFHMSLILLGTAFSGLLATKRLPQSVLFVTTFAALLIDFIHPGAAKLSDIFLK